MMFTMKYKTRELKVKEFHKKFDLDVDSQPRASLLCLRSKLILEEANEVSEVLNEMRSSHADLLEAIANEKELSTENDDKLKSILDNIVEKFTSN